MDFWWESYKSDQDRMFDRLVEQARELGRIPTEEEASKRTVIYYTSDYPDYATLVMRVVGRLGKDPKWWLQARELKRQAELERQRRNQISDPERAEELAVSERVWQAKQRERAQVRQAEALELQAMKQAQNETTKKPRGRPSISIEEKLEQDAADRLRRADLVGGPRCSPLRQETKVPPTTAQNETTEHMSTEGETAIDATQAATAVVQQVAQEVVQTVLPAEVATTVTKIDVSEVTVTMARGPVRSTQQLYKFALEALVATDFKLTYTEAAKYFREQGCVNLSTVIRRLGRVPIWPQVLLAAAESGELKLTGEELIQLQEVIKRTKDLEDEANVGVNVGGAAESPEVADAAMASAGESEVESSIVAMESSETAGPLNVATESETVELQITGQAQLEVNYGGLKKRLCVVFGEALAEQRSREEG